MNKLSIKYAMANPHYPIATSIITAFCQPALKSRTKTLNWKLPRGKEAQDLQNIIYAWTRAYGYDQIIGIPKTLLANTTEGGLKMLLAERLDCFVGPKEETTFAARALNVDIEKYPTKEIAKRNVYLLFLNTQANQKLISIHDIAMKELIDNGKIFALYEKWGVDYHEVNYQTPNDY